MEVVRETPLLEWYVVWKGDVPSQLPEKMKGKVMTWKSFIEVGEKQ